MASLKHLLGISGLNPLAVTNLLDLAESYVLLNRSGKTQRDSLRGRTLINLFFEDLRARAPASSWLGGGWERMW